MEIATAAEARAALLLQYLPKLTPAMIHQLLDRFGSFAGLLSNAEQYLEELPAAMRQSLASYRSSPDALNQQVDAQLEWLQQQAVVLLPLTHEHYPALLKQIHRPPLLLFVQGDTAVLSLPQLAIVGSRNATASGLATAKSFARTLAASGFAITSGLALGVDGAAHNGALETGKTIAVTGAGIDIIYPRSHRQLHRQILESGGAIVTEFLPGTAPRPQHFPQRNRIISGLSLGVMVVEAALKSGSLITARCAMEQDREVFAIPGSIHNSLSKGCHVLLKQGATLVETADDIVAQLGGLLAFKRAESGAETEQQPPEQSLLLDAMGFDPVDMDRLIARTGLPVSAINQQLVTLELAGRVENRNGLYLRVC